MNPEELTKQCKALQRECEEKQSALRLQFAQEHNPVKVGDIVTDHYHTIRVENMNVYGHPIPYMFYTGIVMTKKGVPSKRQPWSHDPVFQYNIKAINGQPYSYEFKNR
jgi:hypothetical protein